MEIWLISLILAAAVFFLVTELVPVDLVAAGIMVALILTGLLTPAQALAGFSHPAPVTVACLFIVSRGLFTTGALEGLSARIIDFTRGESSRLLLLCLVLAGATSAFINNTPVVVLFIPVIIQVCCRYDLSPSKFLIPLSFVSILAGTSTLIGTSTNIIVSDLAAELTGRPIGMFELSGLGAALVLAGGIFLFFFSGKLLPDHKAPVCRLEEDEKARYISELLIPEGSPLAGADPRTGLGRDHPGVEIYEVIRGRTVLDPDRAGVSLRPGDVVLVTATADALMAVLASRAADLLHGQEESLAGPLDQRKVLVELIVPPGSGLVGRHLAFTGLGRSPEVQLIGVKRRQVHYSQQKLGRLRLTVGDIILVQCTRRALEDLRTGGELIVVLDAVRDIKIRRRAPLAWIIFLAMVVAAALGLADILVCAMTAALLMVLGGCLRLSEAYRSLDLKVLLLIVGTIALGAGLERSGAADLYARGFLALFSGLSPAVVLSGFILLTSLLSHFLSNNSTAVLLVPVAVSTAAGLGVDPRPFIIGICFGASACYASPIGYQTNLLVFGPGGYRFGDYLKLGLPLNLLVWAGASVLIPLLWPF